MSQVTADNVAFLQMLVTLKRAGCGLALVALKMTDQRDKLSQYQMLTAMIPTGFTHKSIRLLSQATFIISSETFWISTVQQIITECYNIIFVHYDK